MNSNAQEYIIGTWSATSVVEDVVYLDSGRDYYKEVEIPSGSYIWKFYKNGNASVTGNDGGAYQYYNEGEEPVNYTGYVIDPTFYKLSMTFEDASKSPANYDIVNITDTQLVLRYTTKWFNQGDGEIDIRRILIFKKVN